MDNQPHLESAARGLRASVILSSLVICLLLFWGIKRVFYQEKTVENAATDTRGSSFSKIQRGSGEQPQNEVENVTKPSTAPTEAPTAIRTAPLPSPSSPGLPSPLPETQPAGTSSVKTTPNRPSDAATEFGVLTGKISLKGVPDPEKPLPLDPSCGNLHKGAKPTTQFYVVSSDQGLADVFVYISKGMEGRHFLPPNNSLVLDQVGCVYTPYVAGAMTGQDIEVRNSDPVLHNVHPMPTVPGNREANKAHLPKAAPLHFKWDQPELFLKFKCDVHPWMFSYVSLVPHPYFAVTDAEGNYTLPEVPPGTYEIEFIHRKAGNFTQTVTITAGATTKVDGQFEVPK